jgi:hypothetical protein
MYHLQSLCYNTHSMAGEREKRPSQLDAQGKELQLPKPEAGQRAYQFIQEFRKALEDTSEFQQRFQDQYNMWKRSGYPNAMVDGWSVDYDKGGYHYDVHFDHYPKSYTTTKVGKDSQQLSITKRPHNYQSEELLLQASYEENGEDIQFDSGMIKHLVSEGKGVTYTIEDYSSGTPTAVQRVAGFLKTNFPQPQSLTPPQK